MASELAEVTRRSTPRYRLRNFLSSRGSTYMHTVMPPARCTDPPPSRCRSESCHTASCSSRCTRLAVFSRSSPASVSVTAWAPRCSSTWPSSSSSSFTCRLTADCDTWRWPAARVNVPCSATERNISSWRKSMGLLSQLCMTPMRTLNFTYGRGPPHSPAFMSRGLYDARFEHDGCGVGFVAELDGAPGHRALPLALTALARLAHLGAVAADGRTGDGAGVMTQVPHAVLRPALEARGHGALPARDLAAGLVFLPREAGAQEHARRLAQDCL